MFCDNCGKKVLGKSSFCDNCGTPTGSHFEVRPQFFLVGILVRAKTNFLKIFKLISIKKLVFSFAIIAIVLLGYLGYNSYVQMRRSLEKTSQGLQDTQNELSLLREYTTDAASKQQEAIEAQDKKLTETGDALQREKSSNALLQKTLTGLKQNNDSNQSSNVSGSLLTDIASSIVSLYCIADSYSGNVQQGSGILFKTASSNDISSYQVQTNLHVIATSDGSSSKCFVVLYPNYKNSSVYLVFGSKNFRFYSNNIDVAFLEPEIIQHVAAGSLNDLEIFARSQSKSSNCDSISIGDHLTVLGYPGIGGESLTATDGIVSGFEFEGSLRYIKTSAKIEQGNSGGVAIKDSGCILGIPTYVSTGKIESIGRILDLNYLYSNVLK